MSEREVQDSLLVLCNLLNVATGRQLLCHHFFVAKQNKKDPQTVAAFWSVLHQLTCSSRPQCSWNIVDCVKTELASLGYESLELYALPGDQSYGSRDLLLALSWLIATRQFDTIVGRQIDKSVVNTEHPYVPHRPTPQDTAQLAWHSAVNRLAVQANLLKFKCCNLDHLAKRHKKLLKEVHQATSHQRGVPYLTVLECCLLARKSESFNDYLTLLFKQCDLTEAHILWLMKMDVFLKWMVGVCKQKQADELNGADRLCESTLEKCLTALPSFLEMKATNRGFSFRRHTLRNTLTKIKNCFPNQNNNAASIKKTADLIDRFARKANLTLVRISS